MPKTVEHYKKYLPSCNITIYDNESTDNSVQIAKNLGCNVISWSSNNRIDDLKYVDLKNNCWKNVESGWIIMIDMDEWICVTEDDLKNEFEQGTTILNIKGYDMIGESMVEDLSDLNLHSIRRCVELDNESKKLCFLRNEINEMNYGPGAHHCNPRGNIKLSTKIYINKHIGIPGLPFLINKFKCRFERAHDMRKIGFATHYTDNIEKITHLYNSAFQRSIFLPD